MNHTIRTIYLAALMLLLSATSVRADQVTDSLRHDLAKAQQTKNIEDETLARERLAVTLYNTIQYDSLIAFVPECLQFYHSQQDWQHYYYMWRILVSAYIYSEHHNTALREVRKMYDDAQQRKNNYGLAMASHVMGLAYAGMQFFDEAQKSYERSLKLMMGENNHLMMVSIYGDYCEILSAQNKYEELLQASEGWLDELHKWGEGIGRSEANVDSTIYATYCFVAMAKAHRGLRDYDAARTMLQKATRNAKQYGDDTDEGYWHHVVSEWASFYQDLGQYNEALQANDEALYWARKRQIDTEELSIEEQRAEILQSLGRYQEAAQLFQKVNKENRERNVRDAKNQLSEMSSLFQLDELEMEQQRSRQRYMLVIVAIVFVALLLFTLVRIAQGRRLAQKNKELGVALDRAQESDRMKGHFIQHVSHEVRTPLNIINGFTQLLNTPGYEIPEAERKDMLRQIHENTLQVSQIINELLDLANTLSRTDIEQKDMVTAGAICQKAVTESGIQSTPQVEFSVVNPVPDDCLIKTDIESVVKILSNLLQNSVKFTQKGSITLKTSLNEENHQLDFFVIDTGVGVPEEDRERIFENFEKVDSFRVGIGLGLSLSRALARRLGGDVVLAHSDSSGSTFHLFIPTNPA